MSKGEEQRRRRRVVAPSGVTLHKSIFGLIMANIDVKKIAEADRFPC